MKTWKRIDHKWNLVHTFEVMHELEWIDWDTYIQCLITSWEEKGKYDIIMKSELNDRIIFN